MQAFFLKNFYSDRLYCVVYMCNYVIYCGLFFVNRLSRFLSFVHLEAFY